MFFGEDKLGYEGRMRLAGSFLLGNGCSDLDVYRLDGWQSVELAAIGRSCGLRCLASVYDDDTALADALFPFGVRPTPPLSVCVCRHAPRRGCLCRTVGCGAGRRPSHPAALRLPRVVARLQR